MQKTRLLIIEDEAAIADLLAYGPAVYTLHTGACKNGNDTL
ncbi:hypothetical protein ACFVVQ_07470 [Paenibacillus chitinolyticus]